jgi:hypothetical protein
VRRAAEQLGLPLGDGPPDPPIPKRQREPKPRKVAKLRRRRFTVQKPGDLTKGALTWTTLREKFYQRLFWRLGLMMFHAGQPRALAVARCVWFLTDKDGYCTASDAHISSETGVPLKGVQQALTELDDFGAIIRVHVKTGGEGLTQRRIYLGKKIAERGSVTPCARGYLDNLASGIPRAARGTSMRGSPTPLRTGTEIRRPLPRYRKSRKRTVDDIARKP